MGEVFFYHLTRGPLEITLASLLAKSLQAGWRVAVKGRSERLLDQLDEQLWLFPDDGFLPHGRLGGAHDAAQPILLTHGDMPNNPTCIVLIEGADVMAAEVTAMDRIMILFDGHDHEAVQMAREQWKSLTQAGASAKYWSDADGKWMMKAESTVSTKA